MIALSSTWNWVVMFMVAGGLGLVGGIAAAFIEWKSKPQAGTPAAPAGPASAAGANPADPPPANPPSGSAGPPAADVPRSPLSALNVVACVILGGVAAIGVLYFAPPIKEVEAANGSSSSSYELLKLIPLSLIVGSAGTVFLQGLQSRALNLFNEQRANSAEAKTGAAVAAASKVPDSAKTGIQGAVPEIQATLQGAGLDPAKASAAASAVADKASRAAELALEPQIEAIRMVATTGPGTSPGDSPPSA